MRDFGFGLRLGARGLGGGEEPPPSPVEQAETAAAVAAMTVAPSSERRAAIDALIAGMKADGVWAKLDWLCLLAAHDAQAARINLRHPAKALAAVNAPVFATDLGYAGDGATACLDMGEPLAFAGSLFGMSSATIGVWINDGLSASSRPHAGNASNSSGQSNLSSINSNVILRANASTATTAAGLAASARRHMAGTRIDGANQRVFADGLFLASGAVAAQTPAGTNGLILSARGSYSAARVAAFYSGAGMSDAELAAMHARLGTYLAGIGGA